jgi:hypothetical protein
MKIPRLEMGMIGRFLGAAIVAIGAIVFALPLLTPFAFAYLLWRLFS